VSATSTRTKRPDGRAAKHPSGSDPWGRDPAGTRGDRRLAQADLCRAQANQELGQEEQREGGQKNAIRRTSRPERVEQRKQEAGITAPKRKKKELQAQPPKHVRKREQVQQERQAKRRISHEKREERKREQEEHPAQKQREREERKREQELKRERRLRAQEEREQERLRRLQWHQEIKRERERRLARKQERMARLAAATAAPSSALSTIFADQQALVPLPKPT